MIYKTLFTFFLSMLVINGFAGGEPTLPEIAQVMQLSQVEDDFIEAFSKGEYPNLALELQEGTVVPVSFVSNMGLFSIENFPELKIRIQKTCWLRFVGTKGFISFDQNTWEKPDDLFGCYGDFKTKVRFNQQTQSVTVESEWEECDESDFDWE